MAIFAMVGQATSECLGLHVARRGDRFEALEPVRRPLREQFGAVRQDIALGVRLRHDPGSPFLSNDFQREIGFLGLECSVAFARQPEGNGSIGRLS